MSGPIQWCEYYCLLSIAFTHFQCFWANLWNKDFCFVGNIRDIIKFLCLFVFSSPPTYPSPRNEECIISSSLKRLLKKLWAQVRPLFSNPDSSSGAQILLDGTSWVSSSGKAGQLFISGSAHLEFIQSWETCLGTCFDLELNQSLHSRFTSSSLVSLSHNWFRELGGKKVWLISQTYYFCFAHHVFIA